MAGRTEQLLQAIRHSPIFQSVVPMEAGTGWPIPYRKDDRLYVIVPFYGNGYSAEQKQTLLFPPLAAITVEWKTGRIVEYIDLRFRSPWEPVDGSVSVGVFPHEAIQDLTRADYTRLRSDLMSLYDTLFECLAGGTALPAETTQEFGRLLRLLMEPALESYYRAIAPRFFDRFLSQN